MRAGRTCACFFSVLLLGVFLVVLYLSMKRPMTSSKSLSRQPHSHPTPSPALPSPRPIDSDHAHAQHILDAQLQMALQTKLNPELLSSPQLHLDWFLFPVTAPHSWSETAQDYSIINERVRSLLLANPSFVTIYLQSLHSLGVWYLQQPARVLKNPIRLYKILLSLAQFILYCKKATTPPSPLCAKFCQAAKPYLALLQESSEVEHTLNQIAEREAVSTFRLAVFQGCQSV